MMEALPLSTTHVPLSRTRLSPPVLAAHTIERPRLFPDAALDDIFLGVLIAPSGYGKTTAAYQIASAMDADLCWLTVERSSGDVDRFKAYIAAALGLAAPQPRQAIPDELPDAETLRQATDRFRVGLEQLDRPTVLVLDDFHEITNPVLLQSINEWLASPVPNLTVLCAGRTEPMLPLDKIRSQGRLLELRRADLAFRAGEAAAVFNGAFGVTAPDPPAVAQIVRHTQGWPAITYLAGLDAQGARVLDADRELPISRSIQRFIASETLPSLSEETIDFMMATSVADIVVPDLADAVADTTTSVTKLRSLVENEQFTDMVDAGNPTFQYHPLVRQVLLDQLAATDPDRYQNIHRRAARWYHANDQLANAIHCATASRDVPLGQELVSDCWRSATRKDNFVAVQAWADAVGPDGTTNSRVCLILAWGAAAAGDESNMHRWLTRAGSFAAGPESTEIVQLATNLILAHWSNRTGDLAAMNAHVSAATAFTGPLHAERFDDPALTVLHGAAFCLAGISAFLRGDRDAALVILVDVVAFARQPGHEHILMQALNYLALLDALSERDAYALEHTDEIIDRISRDRNADTNAPVLAYLARSVVFLGNDDDQATSAFEQAALWGELFDGYPIQRGLLELQQARLLHRRGALRQAREAIASARRRARTVGTSILDVQVRSVENELRFLGLGSNEQLPPGARELTEREVEIVHLLPTPMRRAEIAQQLHISENTIKTHLTAISRKLNVRGRAAIVDRATELGLLLPPREPHQTI